MLEAIIREMLSCTVSIESNSRGFSVRFSNSVGKYSFTYPEKECGISIKKSFGKLHCNGRVQSEATETVFHGRNCLAELPQQDCIQSSAECPQFRTPLGGLLFRFPGAVSRH